MTITRQRCIIRNVSQRILKGLTAMDKQISMIMFLHFCFHYWYRIWRNLLLLFTSTVSFSPQKEIYPFVSGRRVISLSYTLFFQWFSDCEYKDWFPIFNYKLDGIQVQIHFKNWVITIQIRGKKFQSSSSKCMHYALCSCISIHC